MAGEPSSKSVNRPRARSSRQTKEDVGVAEKKESSNKVGNSKGTKRVVTGTIYPTGCNAVNPDLNLDELLKSLKLLANAFQNMGQADDESESHGTEYDPYIPLALHLAEEGFLKHPSKDVRLLIGCCLVDILRIFVPTPPYADPRQIEVILEFLIDQLEGLQRPQEPTFKRYFYILESAVYVNCFAMCLEFDFGQKIICKLFGQIFRVISMQHSGNVQTFMLNLLCQLVTNLDHFSNELLNCILSQIMEPLKSTRKEAYNLAKQLVVKCSDSLEDHMKNLFQNAIAKLEDGTADRLLIFRKPYDLAFELYKIGPTFLHTVLTELEYGLHCREVVDRLKCVTLLGQVFTDKTSHFAALDSPLWKGFVGRFNDIDAKIRLKCVEYSADLVKYHPELRPEITEVFGNRINDTDENVRLEVVKSILAIAKEQSNTIADNEDLLQFLKERIYDKKVKVRREAVKCLAAVYKELISETEMSPANDRIATWLKNKILHVYYMSSMDDRLQVERLFNSCLVPYRLDPAVRMVKLLYLFVTLDENAVKAFIEIQKKGMMQRKQVAELLKHLRSYGVGENADNKLNYSVRTLSLHFSDPEKILKFVHKFCSDLKDDRSLMKTMETLVNPATDCETSTSCINTILKKLGSPSSSNAYYGTIKVLLERCSSVLVDKVAIEELVNLVVNVAKNPKDVLSTLQADLPAPLVLERGARLISILAFPFPLHFHDEGILQGLRKLLKFGENIAMSVLQAYKLIGESQPLENSYSTLIRPLTKICIEMLRGHNPQLAKSAFCCLFTNLNEEFRKTVFGQVLSNLKENLQISNPSCRTAIVVLGLIAEKFATDFKKEVKNYITKIVIKDLIMRREWPENDLPEPRAKWCKEEELPVVTKCIIAGLKCVTRWAIGLSDDEDIGTKVSRMLHSFITTNGTFIWDDQSFPISNAEKSWLRLTAGSCLLKLYRLQEDRFTLQEFCDLSRLMTDDVLEVRSRFALKLHKGLSHRIPSGCLSLDFMGYYALSGFEDNLKQRETVKNYLQNDILQRRNCIKLLNLRASGTNVASSSQLPALLPDYSLLFAIVLLTNHPKFTDYKDVDELKKIQSCLWFILEPLILKNEQYSFGFYKTMLEKVKNHITEFGVEQDNKMYAICDLATNLILTKGPNLEMSYPAGHKPRLPKMYFKPHENPGWTNTRSYLPPNMNLVTPTSGKGRKRTMEGSSEKRKRTPARKRARGTAGSVGDNSSEQTAGTSFQSALSGLEED